MSNARARRALVRERDRLWFESLAAKVAKARLESEVAELHAQVRDLERQLARERRATASLRGELQRRRQAAAAPEATP